MTSDVKRAKQIAQEIAALGPVLPGPSAGCHCHDEEPELHGPYWYWTRKVDQKTVSKLLSAEQVPEYAQWFANRHRLRELTHELEKLGIARVEADPRTPRRGQKRAAS